MRDRNRDRSGGSRKHPRDTHHEQRHQNSARGCDEKPSQRVLRSAYEVAMARFDHGGGYSPQYADAGSGFTRSLFDRLNLANISRPESLVASSDSIGSQPGRDNASSASARTSTCLSPSLI